MGYKWKSYTTSQVDRIPCGRLRRARRPVKSVPAMPLAVHYSCQRSIDCLTTRRQRAMAQVGVVPDLASSSRLNLAKQNAQITDTICQLKRTRRHRFRHRKAGGEINDATPSPLAPFKPNRAISVSSSALPIAMTLDTFSKLMRANVAPAPTRTYMNK